MLILEMKVLEKMTMTESKYQPAGQMSADVSAAISADFILLFSGVL